MDKSKNFDKLFMIYDWNFISRLSQICSTCWRYVYRTFCYADIDSYDRDKHYFATSTNLIIIFLNPIPKLCKE